MRVAQLVLATLLVLVGLGLILARHRIAARHRRAPGVSQGTASVLWAFIGTLLLINGAFQLVLAAA